MYKEHCKLKYARVYLSCKQIFFSHKPLFLVCRKGFAIKETVDIDPSLMGCIYLCVPLTIRHMEISCQLRDWNNIRSGTYSLKVCSYHFRHWSSSPCFGYLPSPTATFALFDVTVFFLLCQVTPITRNDLSTDRKLTFTRIFASYVNIVRVIAIV